MGLQDPIGISMLWITKLPHIVFKKTGKFFSFGFCEGQPVGETHLPFIQVVLVLGFRLNIGGIAIADVVEEVVSHLATCWKDLESGGTCPLLREGLVLGVPTIVVAVVSIEGATGLSKIFQGNRTGGFQRLEGGLSGNIVPPDQVVALDLPFIGDVIHHDVAILVVDGCCQRSSLCPLPGIAQHHLQVDLHRATRLRVEVKLGLVVVEVRRTVVEVEVAVVMLQVEVVAVQFEVVEMQVVVVCS